LVDFGAMWYVGKTREGEKFAGKRREEGKEEGRSLTHASLPFPSIKIESRFVDGECTFHPLTFDEYDGRAHDGHEGTQLDFPIWQLVTSVMALLHPTFLPELLWQRAESAGYLALVLFNVL
jgi:hypothetical protein